MTNDAMANAQSMANSPMSQTNNQQRTTNNFAPRGLAGYDGSDMTDSTPPSRPSGPALTGLRLRLRGLAMLACSAGIIALCGSLAPRGGGYGTHQQLGMPDCDFLMRTGWPCPSCGMTTSMAAMARGQVARAFGAHPFGVVLFLAVAAAGAAGLAELAGRNVWRGVRPRVWWAAAGLGLMLLGWGLKALAGMLSGQFPLR